MTKGVSGTEADDPTEALLNLIETALDHEEKLGRVFSAVHDLGL